MGKTIENGIVVSIGNQKGGVGKSVLTSFIANYIHQSHNETGLEIAVIDGDDLQGTLIDLRDGDLNANPEGDFYKLVQISSVDIPDQIEWLKQEFDIIFIDLPGNLKQDGVLNCYSCVDILFIPTSTSYVEIQSTINFIKLYQKEIVRIRSEVGEKTELYAFFNKIDVNSIEFKQYNNDQYKASFPVKFMDNFIPESKVAFQRYVSTVNTYKNNKHNNYSDFAEEMIDKIAAVRLEE